MPSTRTVTKVHIIFNHALFGQGVRSLLRGRRAIKIVGMGKDEAESLKAMDALHPEVIIIEERNGGIGPSTLGTILQRPGAGRVVALNIDHNHATVYDRRPFVITNSEDLVDAIRTGRGALESTCLARGRVGTAKGKQTPRRKVQHVAKP